MYFEAALRLHKHLLARHWNGHALVGPDPVGKIHWRVTRFVRSYLPWLPGDEKYVYLQGQTYWIKSNLKLFGITQDIRYLDLASQCADYVVQCQLDNGAWLHPPIWGRRGFISTVEGVWASLGLLAVYEHSEDPAQLEAALQWYNIQINEIGFREVGDGLAANYYAHSTGVVPNVTTMLIWLAAELHHLTGEQEYLDHIGQMIHFVADCQLDSGELPYALGERTHFMCYQYNAFEFLDLAHYYQLTGDKRMGQILTGLAVFLSSGVTERGSCRYDCFKSDPEVNYWTAALGAALQYAHWLGLGYYRELGERCYQRLVSRQNPDGSFDFSDRNYRFLSDRRSYPRQQAMILQFLLTRAEQSGLSLLIK